MGARLEVAPFLAWRGHALKRSVVPAKKEKKNASEREEGTPLEGRDLQPHKEEDPEFSVDSHPTLEELLIGNHRHHEVTEWDHDNLCGDGCDGERFSTIPEELVEDDDDDDCHCVCLVKRERALPSLEISIHIRTLSSFSVSLVLSLSLYLRTLKQSASEFQPLIFGERWLSMIATV